MKKIKGFWILATVCCVTLLTACAEDDDDFDEPEPSTIDTSVWPITEHMDTLSYRAGDDFFMYCNGHYWKTTTVSNPLEREGFVFTDAVKKHVERILNSSIPSLSKLNSLLAAAAEHPMTDDEMSQYITPIVQLITEAKTNEDCVRVMARLAKMGYTVIQLNECNKNGKACLSVMPSFTVNQDAATALQPAYTASQLLQHPEQTMDLQPLASTRNDGSDVVSIIANELGIPLDLVMATTQAFDVFASYKNAKVEELQSIMARYVLAEDLPYMNQNLLSESLKINPKGRATYEEWEDAIRNMMGYTISYEYAPACVSPQLKEEVIAKCEELRSVFRRRIANLDWMSSTTKERAINKLDYMGINVGYPDQWVKEALVDISVCQTLIEAVRVIRQGYFNLLRGILGTNFKDNGFNILLYSNAPLGFNLTTFNAYYIPGLNTMNILPAFMLPPLYDPDGHDALLYATCTIFAHEFTHGFDSNGAKYDEFGEFRNWWTVQDKMDFEARYQMLIDCYNRLELLPEDPDYHKYNPGEQTLIENIADLGGFEIAHQAYMEKCQREGYYGEELDKQERKFYQAYGNLWRAKYESPHIEKELFVEKDIHSRERERINGVVMNTDRWYELYNVQWGDNLFLRPEKRTHIW